MQFPNCDEVHPDLAHPESFHAVGDAPPGLIRRALQASGVSILQFLQWLRQPGSVAALAQIGVEFATGNSTQAIQDLANLLTQVQPQPQS